ncbi:DNA-3-methyladenine glycosylase 2 family protein [bacterium]|nr:MAG: DNA-3-methyladenine glycosylase 2 family protein [bacterium]
MAYFRYGAKEIEYLKGCDAQLGGAIERIGPIERGVNPDLFTALVNAIVAQQISSKAAATVWGRVVARFGPIEPERLAMVPVEDIQQCGMSMRKSNYIHSTAQKVSLGEIDLPALAGLPDAEVVARLSSLPGIGVWTAEMLMIFSLQRPDILSWNDLAIRRGMQILYGHAALTKAQFESHRQQYSPYGSVASLYLWHIAVEPTSPAV